MDKRGAELSINVIIIAILVIIVLVVIAFFFLGGSSKLFQGIQQVAPGKADIMDVAKSDCQSKCEMAQNFGTPEQKRDSAYCKKQIRVDEDGDGIVDELHRCYSSEVGIICPGIDCGLDAVESIES